MFRTQLKVLLLLLFATNSLNAQNIQTPDEFLGYKIGSRFTLSERAHAYFEYVAKNLPKNVKYQPYGSSYENRMLATAIVSSETNINKIEEIRESNLKRAGLLNGEPMSDQPAILFLSYNIHGNEAVSTETAMKVLYDLAVQKDPEIVEWLKKVVVIIDPCLNPDGHDRYVNFYVQNAGKNPNSSSIAKEHHEPWPGGRYNHYIFDPNRDWAWQTQKETQERIANYYKWMPQVHADFHEMSAYIPYYFAPAAKPYHEVITPWQRELQQNIGTSNKKYFDDHNWLYFTRERFDLFYPSYGDTYPTFNGAVGLTYEQGGSGFAGLALERKSFADTLTLNERIDHHYGSTMATLKALAKYSDMAVKNFSTYFSDAKNKGVGEFKTFIFKSKNNESNLNSLETFLDNKKINYSFSQENKMLKGYHYNTEKNEVFKLETGDLIVSSYQSQSNLIKVLFEPKSTLEDSITYDLTAWSIPLAYGLETYGLKEKIKSGSNEKPKINTAIKNATKPYAYLIKWNSFNSLQFLSALLNQKIKVRHSEKDFEVDGQKFNAGTLIITKADNRNNGIDIDKFIKENSLKFNIPISTLNSGFVEKGNDLGSDYMKIIKSQRIAIISGTGISTTGFGDFWHFFEQQIDYPLTIIDVNDVGDVDWNNFDALILPNGNYNNILSEKKLEKILDWINNGGKLIAVGSSMSFLANKNGFNIKKKSDDKVELASDSYDLIKEYGKRERDLQSEEVPGSIFKIDMENTHPLAFGYGKTYMSLKTDATSYQFLKKDWNVGVIKEDGLVGGFAGSKAKTKLVNSLIFGVQESGRGTIIYMADNPLIRGFWLNGKLLFGNALFMVGNKNGLE